MSEIIEYRYEKLPTKGNSDLIRYVRLGDSDEYVMDRCYLHPGGLHALADLGLSPYADIDFVTQRTSGNKTLSIEAVYKGENI